MRTSRGDKKNLFSSKFSKIRGGGFRTIRGVKYFRRLIIRYARYYQSVVAAINNAKRKYPDHTIYLLGIEGDVQYGKRTRQEWTFLVEDIDKHILDGKISKRPSNMRVSFESFPQVVEMFASQRVL